MGANIRQSKNRLSLITLSRCFLWFIENVTSWWMSWWWETGCDFLEIYLNLNFLLQLSSKTHNYLPLGIILCIRSQKINKIKVTRLHAAHTNPYSMLTHLDCIPNIDLQFRTLVHLRIEDPSYFLQKTRLKQNSTHTSL